jgi:hypothetical protein
MRDVIYFFVSLYITVLLRVSTRVFVWIPLVPACFPPHRLKAIPGRPIGGEYSHWPLSGHNMGPVISFRSVRLQLLSMQKKQSGWVVALRPAWYCGGGSLPLFLSHKNPMSMLSDRFAFRQVSVTQYAGKGKRTQSFLLLRGAEFYLCFFPKRSPCLGSVILFCSWGLTYLVCRERKTHSEFLVILGAEACHCFFPTSFSCLVSVIPIAVREGSVTQYAEKAKRVSRCAQTWYCRGRKLATVLFPPEPHVCTQWFLCGPWGFSYSLCWDRKAHSELLVVAGVESCLCFFPTSTPWLGSLISMRSVSSRLLSMQTEESALRASCCCGGWNLPLSLSHKFPITGPSYFYAVSEFSVTQYGEKWKHTQSFLLLDLDKTSGNVRKGRDKTPMIHHSQPGIWLNQSQHPQLWNFLQKQC